MGMAMHQIIGRDTKRTWNLFIQFCQLAITDTAHFPTKNELQEIDWEGLIQLAKIHQVRPLLYKALLGWEHRELIPLWVSDELQAFQIQQIAKCLDHTKELSQLIQLFATQGIEIIPIKGVLLAKAIYGNWSMREMSDIDFMIKLEDLETIGELLKARGYEAELFLPKSIKSAYYKQDCEFNFDYYEGKTRKYHLEPHWYTGKRLMQTHLNYNEVKPFAKKECLFGQEVWVLSPEGLLITTCLHHGGKDRWSSMKYVTDVAGILHTYGADIDWGRVLRISKKHRILNIVLLGLGIASKMFELQLPEVITKKLASKKLQAFIQLTEKILPEVYRPKMFNNDTIGVMLFQFKLRKSWGTKFKIIFYHLQHIVTPNIHNESEVERMGGNESLISISLKRIFRLLRRKVAGLLF